MAGELRITVGDLLEHVRVLSKEFPDRHGGDPDELGAVEYIAGVFRSYGLPTRVLQVPVMGWELIGGPSLVVEAPEERTLECVPFIFSGSTPAEGLRGELRYVGKTVAAGGFMFEKYAIVDAEGHWQGFVAGREDGPAITQSGPPAGLAGTEDTPAYTWPACVVGQDDLAFLRSALDAGPVRVRYQATTLYRPNSRSYTVEATVLGSEQPEEVVVLGSHHDSQGALGFPPALTSPGANDNASGVAVFLELARHYVARPPRKTLVFAVFGSEERGLLLSREYARMLVETQALDRVVSYLGIDQAAYGDMFRFLSSSQEAHLAPHLDLRPLLAEAVESLRLKERFTTYGPAPVHSASDHWPFFFAGVPSFLTGWHPFPGYHRGSDTFEECTQDEQFLATLQLTHRMIEAVANLPRLGPVERGVFAGHVTAGTLVAA